MDADVLEDWASASAAASEIETRIAALEMRASRLDRAVPSMGEHDDVARFGGRWIALGAVEASIARVLIEHVDQLVTRATIEEHAWKGRAVRPNTTDRQMYRLRGHLRQIGLELHTVRGKGYVLEVAT